MSVPAIAIQPKALFIASIKFFRMIVAGARLEVSAAEDGSRIREMGRRIPIKAVRYT
jgi:hypothetical protein